MVLQLTINNLKAIVPFFKRIILFFPNKGTLLAYSITEHAENIYRKGDY